MKLLIATLAGFAATPATAQTVSDCDWRASLHSVAEPLEDNTRTYANGAVRLTVTDTVEPAVGSFHLVIVGPPYDEVGSNQCKVISLGGSGFNGVNVAAAQASYDPARGLIWDMPVSVYAPEADAFRSGRLIVTLNQSTGAVTAQLQ